MLAVCFGAEIFHFLFDGTSHIDNECELATAHQMKHIQGYSLSIKMLNHIYIGECQKPIWMMLWEAFKI